MNEELILEEEVALRKESVDRNGCNRKNWVIYIVALRKESVDRNYKERPGQKARPKSLSARRAWIEMKSELHPLMASVGRSPQGERG